MNVTTSDRNLIHCVGTDEDGVKWEFSYRTPIDDNEHLLFRKYGLGSKRVWSRLPCWAEPPASVMEFFHGPLIGKGEPSVIEQLEHAVAMVKVALSDPADDSKALNDLAEFMSGRHFDSDDWSTIMDLVRQTGREVNDVEQ